MTIKRVTQVFVLPVIKRLSKNSIKDLTSMISLRMSPMYCGFNWKSHLIADAGGGRTRLPKFKFSAKFPIGLHVILQIQITKFENDCYIM